MVDTVEPGAKFRLDRDTEDETIEFEVTSVRVTDKGSVKVMVDYDNPWHVLDKQVDYDTLYDLMESNELTRINTDHEAALNRRSCEHEQATDDRNDPSELNEQFN